MRLRSKTRLRIILTIACLAAIVWTFICSIPASGDWPWPPGTPQPDNWSVVSLKDDQLAYTTAAGRKPEPDQQYLRNDRTGEMVKLSGFPPREGDLDHWNVEEDGTVERSKSDATKAREGEAQVAWMVRTFIFLAGLFLSFFAAYGLAWAGMFIVTRLLASGHASQRRIHT